MIQPDVYKRLTISESYKKILFMLKEHSTDFYNYYIDYETYTEKNGKSPFGTMSTEEIYREYDADKILLKKIDQITPPCKGLVISNCTQRQDCLYVDKIRKYCRKNKLPLQRKTKKRV